MPASTVHVNWFQWAVGSCSHLCICGLQDHMGAVGPPMPALSMRLEAVPDMGYDPFGDPPQGEVLVKGDAVTKGYYKNEVSSPQTQMRPHACAGTTRVPVRSCTSGSAKPLPSRMPHMVLSRDIALSRRRTLVVLS